MLSNFLLQFRIGLSQSLLGLFACRNVTLHHQCGRTSLIFDYSWSDLDGHPVPSEGDEGQLILLRDGLTPQAPLVILAYPLTVFRGNGLKEILGCLIRGRAKEFGMGRILID